MPPPLNLGDLVTIINYGIKVLRSTILGLNGWISIFH